MTVDPLIPRPPGTNRVLVCCLSELTRFSCPIVPQHRQGEMAVVRNRIAAAHHAHLTQKLDTYKKGSPFSSAANGWGGGGYQRLTLARSGSTQA
jgi:hypothetical protein